MRGMSNPTPDGRRVILQTLEIEHSAGAGDRRSAARLLQVMVTCQSRFITTPLSVLLAHAFLSRPHICNAILD